MAVTSHSGPIIQYGTVLSASAGTGLSGADFQHNEQRGPLYHDLGQATLDPRQAYQYTPGSGVTDTFVGLFRGVGAVDFVPTTASTNAFVSTTTPSAAVTTFALNAASSAAGTYSTTIIAPETGKVTGTLLAIDSTAAFQSFGVAGTAQVWNPSFGTGRCISITTSSSGDAGTYSIAGRDMYGYKMTETLSLTQGTTNTAGVTVVSQKAFKYISAITNTTTPTSTGVSIGIADTFGFPLYVPYWGQNISVNLSSGLFFSAAISPSSASVVFGSTVATQTSTTPDVRGTYKSSTATNGTLRLQMQVTMVASAAAAITSTNFAPFFGQPAFSSV